LYWRLYRRGDCDFSQRVRLWEDASGSLAGLALFEPPDGCDMVLRPSCGGQVLQEAMLDWAESECLRLHGDSTAAAKLAVGGFEGDPERTKLLLCHGYVRSDHGYLHMWRSLPANLPAAVLPAGSTCRSVTSEDEAEWRVAVHRATFAGSKMTADAYRRMMGCAGYLAELDIVVAGPDGAFVAVGNCWLDQDNAVGEFEPVGCHPEYRRKGLAKAVVLEGLKRLQRLGGAGAVVYTSDSNIAAKRLYESCGFDVVSTDFDYVKVLCEAK